MKEKSKKLSDEQLIFLCDRVNNEGLDYYLRGYTSDYSDISAATGVSNKEIIGTVAVFDRLEKEINAICDKLDIEH
jgi:hypothetical protein